MKNELNEKLNWEVEQQELRIGDSKNKSKIAMLRSDTGEILNVCSDRYRPFYNRDLIQLVDKIEMNSSFKLEGFEEFGRGKRLLAFLKNSCPGTLGREEVADYLIIGNSHNSSSSVFAGMSNNMFRCENQFTSDLYSLRVKHLSNLNAAAIDPQIILNTYRENRERLDQQVQEMMLARLDMDDMMRIVDRLVDEVEAREMNVDFNSKSSNRRHEIKDCVRRELAYFGQNVWGFYNGITYYTSNILKGRSGFGITNGLGERLNRLAWEYCKRCVNRNNRRYE
jgi:hypothetical protein